jgi:hypothetical protein
VWRKYEHFCRVYDTLCSKYAHHKIARLPSLERIKKTWRNLAGGGSGGATAEPESSGAAGPEETGVDDAIFLGHAFLQKLQVGYMILEVFMYIGGEREGVGCLC